MIVHNYGKIPEGYDCNAKGKLRELNAKELDKIESLGVDEVWYWCVDFVKTEDWEGGGGDGRLLMRRGNDYVSWFFDLYDFDEEGGLVECIKFKGGKSLVALEAFYCEDESGEDVLSLIEMAYGDGNKKMRGKQTTIEEDMINALIGEGSGAPSK